MRTGKYKQAAGLETRALPLADALASMFGPSGLEPEGPDIARLAAAAALNIYASLETVYANVGRQNDAAAMKQKRLALIGDPLRHKNAMGNSMPKNPVDQVVPFVASYMKMLKEAEMFGDVTAQVCVFGVFEYSK